MKKKIAYIILPRARNTKIIPEKKEFWRAQWYARNKHFNNNNYIEETENGMVPFDQSEVPYTGAYLLSFLKNWDARFIDLSDIATENNILDIKHLSIIIGNSEERVFLFSAFTNNYLFAKKIMQIIKKLIPDSICIIGGPHASALSLNCLNDGFDYVVVNHGDDFLFALDECNNLGQIKTFSNLCYLNESKKMICNKNIKKKDFHRTPPISYLNLPKRYKKTYYTRLFTIFGCPYNCSFCSNILWNNMKALFKNYSVIEQEIEEIISNIDFEEIYVNDETFTVNFEHAKKVADILHNKNLKWGCETRVDRIDKNIIKYLSIKGCKEIDFGIESFDQDILKLANKRTSVSQIEEALTITSNYGIRTHANIMIGLPGETEDTALKTINKTKEFIQKGIINTVDYFIFVPYPGTPIYNNPNKYKIKIKNKNWNDYREDEFPIIEYEHLNSQKIFDLWKYGLKIFSKLMLSK